MTALLVSLKEYINPWFHEPFFFPYDTFSKVFTKLSNIRVMFGLCLSSSLKTILEVCHIQFVVEPKKATSVPHGSISRTGWQEDMSALLALIGTCVNLRLR
jgi:hypothetical protein